MCGIAGVVDRGGALPADRLEALASAMAARLIHRGPDASGVWCDPSAGVALGHRRLSILDLSEAGAQPMVSPSGRYVISYNGEIYNFRDLAADLSAEGHRFRGHSDTEVLLTAIAAWGVHEALTRAQGMFAFAFWDRRERTLTLGRDRVGKKPLYYGRCGRSVAFASELKAFLVHPGFTGDIDRQGLGLFLKYGWVPTPYCIYSDVRKLLPGSYVTVSTETDVLEAEPVVFWSAREAAERGEREPFKGSFEDAVDELERLLGDAVGKRMISDVPLGALLSGGIDSSSIVSLMQAQSDRPVKTFSIGVDSHDHDEAEYAKVIAAHLGTDHRELYVTREDVSRIIPDLPKIYDEPFADSSQIPTFLVSELARREVTVALSGDGGDEAFIGYPVYHDALRRWDEVSRLPLAVRRPLASALRAMRRRTWSAMNSAPARAMKMPSKWHRRASRLAMNSWQLSAECPEDMLDRFRMSDPFADTVTSGKEKARSLFAGGRGPAHTREPLRAMRYMDVINFMSDDVLVKVDRASMATSLEVRSPILDHRVIEFAWSLPLAYCLDGRNGKRILKSMLERYVPRPLFDRPKQGFALPSEWLRESMREWVGDQLSEERLRNHQCFDAKALSRFWRQHRAGWKRLNHVMFHLAIFEGWRTAQQRSTITNAAHC